MKVPENMVSHGDACDECVELPLNDVASVPFDAVHAEFMRVPENMASHGVPEVPIWSVAVDAEHALITNAADHRSVAGNFAPHENSVSQDAVHAEATSVASVPSNAVHAEKDIAHENYVSQDAVHAEAVSVASVPSDDVHAELMKGPENMVFHGDARDECLELPLYDVLARRVRDGRVDTPSSSEVSAARDASSVESAVTRARQRADDLAQRFDRYVEVCRALKTQRLGWHETTSRILEVADCLVAGLRSQEPTSSAVLLELSNCWSLCNCLLIHNIICCLPDSAAFGQILEKLLQFRSEARSLDGLREWLCRHLDLELSDSFELRGVET
jgi:hypothetical protein